MLATYDVIVLGGAFSGSAIAMTLSRVGFKVLVADNGSHPRFAIGEAMVPSTTFGFEYLARKYRIPEFHHIFSYPGLTSIGCAGYPKQCFFFGLHQPGEPLRTADQLMLEAFELPLGPDVHMLRADVDAYLASRLPAYGVDYLANTTVAAYEPRPDGVHVQLSSGGAMHAVQARLVVDALGAKSYLAHHYNLRDAVPQLRTNTRGIFSHFENVKKLEDVLGSPNPAFRFSRDGGTIHHCFKGGWIWVIPFNNGITSVGLVLDCNVLPCDARISPEEEFYAIIRRFPTVEAQFGDMKPLLPLMSAQRIQYTARSILGEGFVLAPTSAAFVDALFSTGFAQLQSFIIRFVPVAERLLRDPNYVPSQSLTAFRPLEQCFFTELDQIDLLVSGMIESFRDFDVFKQYWRLWPQASFIQLLTRAAGYPERTNGSGLIFGAGIESWRQVVRQMYETLYNDAGNDAEVAARLKAIMDAQGEPVPAHYTSYDIGSDRASLWPVRMAEAGQFLRWLRRLYALPDVQEDVRLRRYVRRLLLPKIAGYVAVALRYRWSRLRGTQYHRDVDFIRSLLINDFP